MNRANVLLVVSLFVITVRVTAQPSQADSIYHAIKQQLNGITWRIPFEEWKGSHGGGHCEEFHGDSFRHLTDGEWCFKCDDPRGHLSVETFFYAFGRADSPACRLEQVRCSMTGYTLEILSKAHDLLVKDLSRELNASPNTPQAFAEDAPVESGSARWVKWIRLQNERVSVYVYLTSPGDTMPTLWLLARDSSLVLEKSRADRLWMVHDAVEESITRQLSDVPILKNSLASRFLGNEIVQDSASEDTLFTTVDHLLNAKTADEGAANWLAADLLAKRLVAGGPTWDERRVELSKYGLSFTLGEVWYYHRNLLRRTWQQFPAGKWGQASIVLLMNMGFDSTGGCGSGVDQFTAVIAEGEKFLKEYPSTVWENEVSYILAGAYETWWSVTRSRDDDDYAGAEADAYRAGAGAALLKAIGYYEKVDQNKMPAEINFDIQHRLPRLKLGIDTNQRSFWCIND